MKTFTPIVRNNCCFMLLCCLTPPMTCQTQLVPADRQCNASSSCQVANALQLPLLCTCHCSAVTTALQM